MRRNLILLLIVIGCVGPLFGQSLEGNSTLSGVNGYIVIPSAIPINSDKNPTITTGYSAIFDFQKGFAHIPYLQVGFKKAFETSLSFDISDSKADALLNGKWRFVDKNNTSVAVGVVGQLHDFSGELDWAAQLYFASTFNSTFVSWPSKTTLILGYTFENNLNSNIDFGMGFQAPLWEKVFKGKVDFLIDFGNVSYSHRPSGGDPKNRGMFNIGVRLLPIQIIQSTYLTAELRLIDLFDHTGRALSGGLSISFRP